MRKHSISILSFLSLSLSLCFFPFFFLNLHIIFYSISIIAFSITALHNIIPTNSTNALSSALFSTQGFTCDREILHASIFFPFSLSLSLSLFFRTLRTLFPGKNASFIPSLSLNRNYARFHPLTQ